MENTKKSCHKARHWHNENIIKNLSTRLNRIEGQVRGINRMIKEGAYCDDVLNQIASVQSALNGVAKLLLSQHMKTCIKDQIIEGDDNSIDEVLDTVFRFIN